MSQNQHESVQVLILFSILQFVLVLPPATNAQNQQDIVQLNIYKRYRSSNLSPLLIILVLFYYSLFNIKSSIFWLILHNHLMYS